MRFSFSFLLCLLAAAACGGKATSDDDGTDDDAGTFGRGPDGGADGNGFVDPHCPEAGAPISDLECNVFEQNCTIPGSACYPSAIPPQGPCESEVYGSFCLPMGVGSQGAPCDNGDGCAEGFVCLITGANTQCARLCDLGGGAHGCSNGFVCEPIDVPGFSACL
ncbi:MAG TPA: hypothetical protein VGH28_12715 [Polyangiaceae bacterium]|jgi:hypothetical protein